jgi:hypothetical protein
MLIPNTPTATITSGANSEVSLPNGTKVKFDGSFKDASGNAYLGNVQVSLYHLKPTNSYLSELMPGSLLASNASGEARVLETFGMLHVELTGSAGEKLNLANGHTAEISIDIDASQLGTSPTTIPLWSFEEREAYVKARVALHEAAFFDAETGGSISECTPEEMWEKPTMYAVKKDGAARAKSVHKTLEEAQAALEVAKTKGYGIEVREGDRTRCSGFCQIAQYCDQYQTYLKEKE